MPYKDPERKKEAARLWHLANRELAVDVLRRFCRGRYRPRTAGVFGRD